VYSVHFVPFFEKEPILSGVNVCKQNFLCALLQKVLNVNYCVGRPLRPSGYFIRAVPDAFVTFMLASTLKILRRI